MQRLNILQRVALTGWCVLLSLGGANAQGLGEKQLLYETLPATDQSAVRKMIKDYYLTLYEKYGGGQAKDDRIRKDKIEVSGFMNIEEFQGLGMDEVLPVTYVRLDDLKNYSESDPLENLIVRRKVFIVPIHISDTIRQAPINMQPFIVVVPSNEEIGSKIPWQISQSGPYRSFQALVDGRKDVNETDYKSADSSCQCFMIWIPALNQYFLGDQTSGELKIKLLKNGPGELKKGQLVSASVVFKELAKEAKTKKYDYPEFKPQKPPRS